VEDDGRRYDDENDRDNDQVEDASGHVHRKKVDVDTSTDRGLVDVRA
jgi:hypothetical protein